jgi:DNA/RNA-binding domain of Phe-tRNA-synthetase-like protein
MPFFCYHPDLLLRYPQLCGGILLARDIHNRPTPPEVQQAYLAEQQATLQRIGQGSLAEIPALAGWRSAFRAFGVDPTKYRSAAESLLRRLAKKGDIPSIHLLVDLYNLVSIRYALPMAAFDLRELSGDLTVRFAEGDEWFTAHDEPQPVHPEPGEVIFVDDRRLIFARRWCWKQSLQSTTALDTTTALITIEAQHETGRQEVQAAMSDLAALLERHASAACRMDILGAERPEFEW